MTKEDFIEISIICPACGKEGGILTDGDIIANSARGVSAVNVSEDFICKHSFVVYVDRNFVVRDSFICDFKINIPKILFKLEEEEEEEEIKFDVEIVKINLIPTLLINVLKGIFYGKKIVILFEEDFVSENLIKFFKYITLGSFRLDLEIITHQLYQKNKKSYKDWIILEKSEIIQDKEKFIVPKQLKIESAIAQKFYSELDSESSLIIIKNELNKTYKLTESLVDFAKDFEENDELSLKTVSKYYKTEYNTELDLNYVKFLMNVLEIYFGVQPRKPSEGADFLGLL